MKGYRTIITNIVLGLFALAAVFGLDITEEQQDAILKGVLALGVVANVLLRFYTDTPVFKNKQSGHAPVAFLLSIVGVSLVAGCALLSSVGIQDKKPWQPFKDCLSVYELSNEAIASCVVSIEILATYADTAADAGVITSEQEFEFLTRLQTALDILEAIADMNNEYEKLSAFKSTQIAIGDLTTNIPSPE